MNTYTISEVKNLPTVQLNKLLPVFLILLFYFFSLSPGQTQITYDGNGANAEATSLPFTVPAGTDRLLVISVCDNDGDISNVAFNNMNATNAVSQSLLLPNNQLVTSAIYYLPLGSGGPISSTILVTSTMGIINVGAGSFQNIDQSSPLGNTNSTNSDVTGNSDNPSLNVFSTTGNLIFDKIFNASFPPTPDASQTLVFSGPSGIGSSFEIATSGTTTMSQTLQVVESYTYSVAEFVAAPPAPVPTLSEWGLIILALLIMTLGMLFLTAPTTVLSSGQTVRGGVHFRQLPFERGPYFKILAWVGLTLLVIFTIAVVLGYELTSADPYGVVVTAPILAYLILLLKMAERKE